MSADVRTTPAPWTQERASLANVIMIRGPMRADGTQEAIAAADTANAEANATLICAAHGLLAALKGLMAFAPAASLTAGPELSAWVAARAAIAFAQVQS